MYEEQYRAMMADSTKYPYGGYDPSIDFEDRIYRYQQFGYLFSYLFGLVTYGNKSKGFKPFEKLS